MSDTLKYLIEARPKAMEADRKIVGGMTVREMTVGGASRGDFLNLCKIDKAAPAHPCARGIPFILNI
jgi:hypothetical protein